MKIQASTVRAATRPKSVGSAAGRVLNTAANDVRRLGRRVGNEAVTIRPPRGLRRCGARRGPPGAYIPTTADRIVRVAVESLPEWKGGSGGRASGGTGQPAARRRPKNDAGAVRV